MTALTLAQHKSLHRYEATIRSGLASFVEVGEALMSIREEKLYRAEFKTFQDYCKSRWGFKDAHARRLITASGVAKECAPIWSEYTPKPFLEAHARVLADVPADKRREVIEGASKQGRGISADRLQAARRAASVATQVQEEEDQVSSSVESKEEADDCTDFIHWLESWLEKGTRRMAAARWDLKRLPVLAADMAKELKAVKKALLS